MKKFAKRFVAFFAVCALSASVLPVNAEAQEYVDYISFEEYSAIIEAEYAKYGIEGGVYKPEGEFICTSEDLETSLAVIREYIASIDDVENTRILENGSESSDCLIPSVMPTAMPVTVTMTSSYLYSDLSLPILPATCTIQTTADITVNAQDATIMSASSPSLEIVEGFGIADWIEYVSHTTTINQAKKTVTMTITCKIKREINVGAATSWSKQTITYTTNFKNIPYI